MLENDQSHVMVGTSSFSSFFNASSIRNWFMHSRSPFQMMILSMVLTFGTRCLPSYAQEMDTLTIHVDDGANNGGGTTILFDFNDSNTPIPFPPYAGTPKPQPLGTGKESGDTYTVSKITGKVMSAPNGEPPCNMPPESVDFEVFIGSGDFVNKGDPTVYSDEILTKVNGKPGPFVLLAEQKEDPKGQMLPLNIPAQDIPIMEGGMLSDMLHIDSFTVTLMTGTEAKHEPLDDPVEFKKIIKIKLESDGDPGPTCTPEPSNWLVPATGILSLLGYTCFRRRARYNLDRMPSMCHGGTT